MSLQNILFLGHQTDRTGAPLILLEFLRWMTKHSAMKPAVLLKRGGEIQEEYRCVAPTVFYEDLCKSFRRRLGQRLRRRLRMGGTGRPNLNELYPVGQYPVVFANTIETCDLVEQLSGGARRVVHRIPELPYLTDKFGGAEALRRGIPTTDAYIAVSQAVADYLREEIGVPGDKIHVVHGFPVAHGFSDGTRDARRSLRRALGIPDDAFVVGTSGMPQWRKGIDLFVQLAMYVRRRPEMAQCHFLWLGGKPEGHREMAFDAAHLGLTPHFHCVPAVSNPQDYFQIFDIYTLMSREEAFSVSMLEAAASGLPIVCFADAGGGPELVEQDAGMVVPYLDVPAMAQACVSLLLNECQRRQLGNNARQKVRSRFLLANQGPKLLAVIESVMHTRGADHPPMIRELVGGGRDEQGLERLMASANR